ncbi:MAG: hypothetical protein IPM92_09005 [Saprospiraceae bacterium]|nr:hypothetical protein [Saprospiraceae bacterium]
MYFYSGFVILSKQNKTYASATSRLQRTSPGRCRINTELDELAAYLEEETVELYKVLQEVYEPMVAEIYQEVAEQHPLQLPELEKSC